MGMIGNTLAQGLISGANIQDGTVDTVDIKDGAVTTAKIADGAIVTVDIANGAVTPAKLSTGAPTWDSSGNLTASGKLFLGGSASDLSSTTQAMIMGSGGLAVQYTGTTGTFLKITPGAADGVVDLKADARSGGYPALTFTTGNAERARIDANGNLAFGTTTISSSSTDVLTIGKNSNANDVNVVIRQFGANTAARMQLIAADDSGAAYNNIASSTSGGTQHWRLGGVGGFTGGLAIFTSGSERARIDSYGSLLIGATTQAYNNQGYMLSLKSSGNQSIISLAKSGQTLGSGGILLGCDATTGFLWLRENQPLTFGTNNSERARIGADGNFTVGGYNVMRFRGGIGQGDMDSYWGSAYDGYYSIAFSGHSGWLFVQNSASSAGTIQMYSTYYDGPWYRSRTDNASWTAWRQL